MFSGYKDFKCAKEDLVEKFGLHTQTFLLGLFLNLIINLIKYYGSKKNV